MFFSKIHNILRKFGIQPTFSIFSGNMFPCSFGITLRLGSLGYDLRPCYCNNLYKSNNVI